MNLITNLESDSIDFIKNKYSSEKYKEIINLSKFYLNKKYGYLKYYDTDSVTTNFKLYQYIIN